MQMAAKAETKAEIEAEVKEETADEVEVFIPRDNINPAKNQYVAVNGVGMLVPIGKRVKIPKAYAEVLQNSFTQREKAYEYIENIKTN